jgi:hypothetical protein
LLAAAVQGHLALAKAVLEAVEQEDCLLVMQVSLLVLLIL